MPLAFIVYYSTTTADIDITQKALPFPHLILLELAIYFITINTSALYKAWKHLHFSTLSTITFLLFAFYVYFSITIKYIDVIRKTITSPLLMLLGLAVYNNIIDNRALSKAWKRISTFSSMETF